MLVNRIVVDLWQGCRRNVKIERFISLHLIGTLIIASPPQSRSHVQTEACGAERPFRSGKEHAAEEADEGARGRLRLQRVAYVCGGSLFDRRPVSGGSGAAGEAPGAVLDQQQILLTELNSCVWLHRPE